MVPFEPVLRRSVDAPLQRQLYDELRAAVLAGRLAPGGRLPSTRVLAASLGVSRNTVTGAFEQLLAEGYLEGRVGSGTYVAEKLPEEFLHVRDLGTASPRSGPAAGLSRRGEALAAGRLIPPRPHRLPRVFRPSPPEVDTFPTKIWARLVAKRWRTPSRELLFYGSSRGYPPLREAIAAYARAARGVDCATEQVVVVSGSQQALDLAVRLLLDPGDRVWIEDPGYLGARGALLGAGARLVPVPVDADGLDIAAGMRRCPRARLVYVTPSRQYPLGVTMSLTRRLALLEWAGRSGAWILEDDYDSQYRYAGRPIASLQGLDRGGHVVYIGTFSKVLFPSLRLGYLILPPSLVDAFAAARAVADQHSPLVDQAVLAEFIADGHFARHLRRMRSLYAERQEALVDAARRDLGGLLEVAAADAGMHLVGWLPPRHDDAAASRRALAQGIEAPALSAYSLEPAGRPGLVLGYAAFTPREIRAGVRKLAVALGRPS